MALDVSAADSVLKIHYQGPVREQLNNAHVLLTKVRKESRNYVGKQAYVPIHTGRNSGTGARPDSGTLPTPGEQQYNAAIFTPKYNYVRIQLTGPAISAMKTNKGAFIRAIKSEMRGAMVDGKQQLQRQCWGDGTGLLTMCTSANTVSSTTVEVNSTKYIEEGMNILFAQIDDGATPNYEVVNTITDENTFEIVTAEDLSTDADQFGVYLGEAAGNANRSTAAWGTPYEIFGLQALVSDQNPGLFAGPHSSNPDSVNHWTSAAANRFGQLDRGTVSKWRANVLTNSGTNRALTIDLMQQAVDEADIASDTTPGLGCTSHAILRRYASLMASDKRYPGDGEVTLDGGWKGLSFAGIPIIADKSAGNTENPSTLDGIYFLSIDALEWQLLEDWQWMDRDGAVLSRVADQDAYEATAFCYTQLGAESCNRHTWLGDISESA